jgi:hypothetical protein
VQAKGTIRVGSNSVEWIFSAFLGVSLIHMGEEFFYPGGFMETIKRLNPKFAPSITKPMAVIINSMQLLVCIIIIVVGKKVLVFGMSIAALLFINGLVHILACIKVKGYAPGILTGVLLYLPLSSYAYYLFTSSGLQTANEVVITGVLGLLYQALPMGYFVLTNAMRRA